LRDFFISEYENPATQKLPAEWLPAAPIILKETVDE